MDIVTELFEHRKTAIRKAKPIVDRDIISCVSNVNIFNTSSDTPIAHNQYQFIDDFIGWVNSSEIFKINGLETFENVLVTNGITDAFNDFYYLNKNVFVLKGEYLYHRDIGINVVDTIYEIPSHSSFIISYPFSATGNVHDDWDKIIQVCEDRKINVFIDLAFFGVSSVPDLDVSSECITHIAFSFSKAFATGGMRTGVMFTKEATVTPISNQNKFGYTNMAGQIIHHELIRNFSPDYIYSKYREKQIGVCRDMSITPSSSVLFGVSTDRKWDYYDRDGYINRMCISYALQDFSSPLVIK